MSTPAKQARTQSYRVKTRSRNGSTRFAKLKACACFKDVQQRMFEGWPLSQVAKFIQIDRKEYTDVTSASLVSVLQEYRATIPPGKLISQTTLLPIYNKAADAVDAGLDEIKELEKLYVIQLERIELDRALEKKLGKLLTTMTPEIRAAKDILQARAQLKMDLGLTDRHLGTAEVEVNVKADLAKQHGSPAVEKTLGNDESRRKLLGIAEKVVALSRSKRADALGLVQDLVGVAHSSGAPADLPHLPEDLKEDLEEASAAVQAALSEAGLG